MIVFSRLNVVSGLGAAFASLVNPVSLATMAFVGAGAAAIQYFSTTGEEARTLDELLEQQADAVARVRDLWGEAADQRSRYGRDSTASASPFKQLAEAIREAEVERRRLFDDRGPNGMLLSQGTTNRGDMGNLALYESQKLAEKQIAAKKEREAFLNRLLNGGSSGSNDLFGPATQSANDLSTAIGGVATAYTGVIDVTQSLAMAQMQQFSALERSSSNLRAMKKDLADISIALKEAANIPPFEIFGNSVTRQAGAEAIEKAAHDIEKLFAALKNGGTTAQTVHEAIEMIRQSLKAMGGDSAAVDLLIDKFVAGQKEGLRLAAAIQQASRSAGGAFYSDGTPVPAAAIAPAYRTRGYLVDQSDIDTMYQTLGYQISGARAAGGPVSAGGTYLVGERGPELLQMGGSGQVTNTNSTASILSGGRDTLSLIEDHAYSTLMELRIQTGYWADMDSDMQEMIACLKALKTASASYSGGSSYAGSSSSGGSYSRGGSSSGGSSHLDQYSPYYFNAARNFAGRGGGRYDPVADAMLNGNVSALNGVSGGPTQGLANMLADHGPMPSLLDRMKRQLGFATGGQIMPGEDQRVEFFKKRNERVIVVDDSKVSDSRGGQQQPSQDMRPIQITNHFHGDVGDARSRQSMEDQFRRAVQLAVRR